MQGVWKVFQCQFCYHRIIKYTQRGVIKSNICEVCETRAKFYVEQYVC